MSFSFQDILNTLPLSILLATAFGVILVEALSPKSEAASFWLSMVGLILAAWAALNGVTSNGEAYSGLLSTGGFADFFALVFVISGGLNLLLSRPYLPSRTEDRGEYYVLVLFSVAGMILMASATDLIVLFLGLELMSLSFYVLAGYTRKSLISNEASLKYFLLGAFATGFILYGAALVYGVTGSTALPFGIPAGVDGGGVIFQAGLALLLIGLLFKIAAVPFHMWVPDVYEGSPTPVSGLMSTGGKAAAFSAIVLMFGPAFVPDSAHVRDLLAIIAALSMITGNILALAQESIKRMLAYSSVAHAGYILTGIVAGNEQGATGVLFYLLAYTVMNIGAFGIVAAMEREGKTCTYADCEGLGSGSPLLAGLLAFFMFSLTGIPPFAGFFAKYAVFSGAVAGGYTWLAVTGVMASLVSVYYYLRLVVVMYFGAQSSQPAPVNGSPFSYVALVLSALIVLLLGIFPSPILDLTNRFF
jgi:NADH-quinone oxidoreductase subunit N